jgi:hypothetical protein
MMFWILSGLLTALVTGLIVAPLRKQNRILCILLTILIPSCALGLYLLGGNPELAQ